MHIHGLRRTHDVYWQLKLSRALSSTIKSTCSVGAFKCKNVFGHFLYFSQKAKYMYLENMFYVYSSLLINKTTLI